MGVFWAFTFGILGVVLLVWYMGGIDTFGAVFFATMYVIFSSIIYRLVWQENHR